MIRTEGARSAWRTLYLVAAVLLCASLACGGSTSASSESDVSASETSTVAPEPSLPTPTATASPTPTRPPGVEGVTTVDLNLRAGPGTDYDNVGLLEKGGSLEILGQTDDGTWYRGRTLDGTIVWVAARYIALQAEADGIPTVSPADLPATPAPAPTRPRAPTPSPGDGVATANVNLRAGPGTDYAVLAVLNAGDTVRVLGRTEDGTWYRVRTRTGELVWLAAAYVTVSGSADAVPTVSPQDVP
jgi:uncharacterized protein YraI